MKEIDKINKYLNRGMKDGEEDSFLSDMLATSKQRRQEREDLERLLKQNGIIADESIQPINWQRYALVATVVGSLVVAAILYTLKKPKPPVRPPARPDVASLTDQYLSKSIERRVAMGTTKVVDIESLYNDINDSQAFDKIIAELEPKGNRRTSEETFYLAKSYAQKQQLDKVAERLKSFDFDKYEFGVDVQWFYALTLLKLKRTTEAIPVLQAIEKNAANPPALRRESTDLLKDLSPQ